MTYTTSKLYDIDSALRILSLIDKGADVATATATETPIGEVILSDEGEDEG